jgi:hypothetical protein
MGEAETLDSLESNVASNVRILYGYSRALKENDDQILKDYVIEW